MSVIIQTLRGDEFDQWIDPVADLRIRVFREYPYLYAGDIAYERQYLKRYQESEHSVLVLALDGEQVVGASTGLPLRDADPAFQAPFHGQNSLQQSFSLDDVFYFGESVLLSAYRGSGIGHRFFDERERVAKQWGYHVTAFCAVVRPEGHPARPEDYQSHDAFWNKRGYQCRRELQCEFPWLDIGQDKESLKTMLFWLREW